LHTSQLPQFSEGNSSPKYCRDKAKHKTWLSTADRESGNSPPILFSFCISLKYNNQPQSRFAFSSRPDISHCQRSKRREC
jgi:hypothetical protein